MAHTGNFGDKACKTAVIDQMIALKTLTCREAVSVGLDTLRTPGVVCLKQKLLLLQVSMIGYNWSIDSVELLHQRKENGKKKKPTKSSESSGYYKSQSDDRVIKCVLNVLS